MLELSYRVKSKAPQNFTNMTLCNYTGHKKYYYSYVLHLQRSMYQSGIIPQT